MAVTINKKIVPFYLNLQAPELPDSIGILYPYGDAAVKKVARLFYNKFFTDNNKRRLLLGINPGRFGAGITGINFTAPKQLKENCGIDHPFKMASELSAEFIYEAIEAYGGAEKFYSSWFLGALSPLGYTKAGKNINYYDEKLLMQAVTPFIETSIARQASFNILRDRCLCIGEDKNYRFLSLLNEKHQWFDNIIPLPHPRFVMQYRRKQKEKYILQYIEALS